MSLAVGMPLDRVDGRLKVTGGARYTADEPIPNLAHAALVLSTIANGSIARLDTAAAEGAPGVIGVLTSRNAPRVAAPLALPPAGQTYIPLQDEAIHYAGQPVAVVIAETFAQAQRAAELVVVEYVEEPAVATLEQGLAQAFVPETTGFPLAGTRGDPERGLADADVLIEQTYTTANKHHNPIEPAATIAVPDGDHLTIYETAQGISMVQTVVAQALGLPLQNVRVITRFVGGGFGCKGWVWPHTILAAMAARELARPVKLVLTRAESYTAHGYQAATYQRVRLGATRDGRLTGIIHESTNQTSPFDNWAERAAAAGDAYACPNFAFSHRLVRVNAMTPTPARSPQEALGMIAVESAMDEMAYALDLDPLALRIRNNAEVDQTSGHPWSSKHLLECYQIGAERFGWTGRKLAPRSMRDGNQLIGWGMATALHSQYRFPAAARARILADGSAVVQSGTQDIGTGTYTVMTQIAADALGLPLEKVRFELGDTNFPAAGVSAGSSTVVSVGPVVHRACLDARDQVLRLVIGDEASPLHGAAEGSIGFGAGRLFLTADPERGETYAEVLARHGLESVEGSDASDGSTLLGVDVPPPGSEAREQFAIYSFGALFAEVRVDADLGFARVSRLVAAYDVGTVVNPKTARSQMIGGIIWGLAQALVEHTDTDPRNARILNPNLSQYLVPVHADVPDIDVQFVESFDPHSGPLGTKNVGELSAIGAPAAVANAIFHATGKRIRDFPITLDKLM